MITQAYADFFEALAKNNHRDWFQANKQDYEAHVKKPFMQLLDALIPELTELEPAISLSAKDALFRINRDIRFSLDKTPYNTLMKAGFSAGGKKSFLPGFYLGISADTIHIGGGLFTLKGPELKKVRQLIANDTNTFVSIVEDDSFKKSFGTLKGEQAKRLDKELRPVLEITPYIANKQFYSMTTFPLEEYLNDPELKEKLMPYFVEVSALNNYLKKAF